MQIAKIATCQKICACGTNSLHVLSGACVLHFPKSKCWLIKSLRVSIPTAKVLEVPSAVAWRLLRLLEAALQAPLKTPLEAPLKPPFKPPVQASLTLQAPSTKVEAPLNPLEGGFKGLSLEVPSRAAWKGDFKRPSLKAVGPVSGVHRRCATLQKEKRKPHEEAGSPLSSPEGNFKTSSSLSLRKAPLQVFFFVKKRTPFCLPFSSLEQQSSAYFFEETLRELSFSQTLTVLCIDKHEHCGGMFRHVLAVRVRVG